MKPRSPTPRRHIARRAALAAVLAILGVVASWRRGTAQSASWTATPATPTVGDTIWLEREIPVPAGWRVRAGKLEPRDDVEPLGDPAVLRSPAGWVDMEDAETGQRVLIDTSHAPTRTRVRVAAERQLQERSRKLLAAGVDRVMLQTSVPYAVPLRRAFAERAKRLKR